MASRLLFMGSDPIALPLLQALGEGLCGELEIGGVYTQPDRPRGRGKKIVPNEIKVWAQQRGLGVRQPEKLGKAQRLEIEAMKVDAILVMAYGHLLSQKLIDVPPRGILNLHTSLLPRFRGASPIQCAVASGIEETGVTLMRMVRRMDAGPIIDQQAVPIERLDTALDVEAKLAQACLPLLKRSLPPVLAGRETSREQDEREATYVRKLSKEDGELDFNVEARTLAKRINGLYPWPGTRLQIGEDQLRLGLADWEGSAIEGAAPGQVLPSRADAARIACGQGVLVLKRLQRPGGRMMEAQDFLRGYDWPVGDRLPSIPMSELESRAEVSG